MMRDLIDKAKGILVESDGSDASRLGFARAAFLHHVFNGGDSAGPLPIKSISFDHDAKLKIEFENGMIQWFTWDRGTAPPKSEEELKLRNLYLGRNDEYPQPGEPI